MPTQALIYGYVCVCVYTAICFTLIVFIFFYFFSSFVLQIMQTNIEGMKMTVNGAVIAVVFVVSTCISPSTVYTMYICTYKCIFDYLAMPNQIISKMCLGRVNMRIPFVVVYFLYFLPFRCFCCFSKICVYL